MSAEQVPDEDAATRFSQRVFYLITSDPDLKVAETVGVLVMLATELSVKALNQSEEAGDE